MQPDEPNTNNAPIFNPLNKPPEVANTPSNNSLPPPVPNPLKRDHSISSGEQHTVDLNSLPKSSNNLFQSDQQNVDNTSNNYDFILNASSKKQSTFMIPKLGGLSPLLTKLLMGLVGLILLVIIYGVISNLTKAQTNFPELLVVAQDQQQLVNITSSFSQQTYLSTGNLAFNSSANLVLTSNVNQLINYLKVNGNSITAAQLNAKNSQSVINALTNDQANGTFNTNYNQYMISNLTSYESNLNSAYSVTKGTHGKALLLIDYNDAKLLLKMLS